MITGQRHWCGIATAAKIVGVDTHVLRRWCQVYKIKPRRTRGGHRIFTPLDIERLAHIKKLRDLGLGRPGVRRAMVDGLPYIAPFGGRNAKN